MDRIQMVLKKYKGWCEKLGIVNIDDVNRIIKEGKTNQLINVSEIWHEQNISEIAEEILCNIDKKKIVLISGPSSSGKTSFANKLQLHLKVLGLNAVSISMDDYYKDPENIPKDSFGVSKIEDLEAIDYERFNCDMADLVSGKTAYIPAFDFEKSKSTKGERAVKLQNDEIIIVEGIHALNSKITDNIADDRKYKVYCSALTALSRNDGERIKSQTTRQIRRLIRDNSFRNTSYQRTFRMWPEVEAGAQRNIYPYTDSADIIFNSSLLYELAVYKSYIGTLFEGCENDSQNIKKINKIRELLNSFREINTSMIPPFSLIREFIGGSTLDL